MYFFSLLISLTHLTFLNYFYVSDLFCCLFFQYNILYSIALRALLIEVH